MLGLVLGSSGFRSANDLCGNNVSMDFVLRRFELRYLQNFWLGSRCLPLGPGYRPNGSSSHLSGERQSLSQHDGPTALGASGWTSVESCQRIPQESRSLENGPSFDPSS